MRQRLILGLGAATTALTTWYLAVPASLAAQVRIAWSFIAVVHLCLGAAAFFLARTPGLSAAHRRFWWAVTAGAAVYLAGDLAQIGLTTASPDAPQALTGGRFQLGALSAGSALLMLALLTAPLGFSSRRERNRFWLDVAAVMSAAVVVGWYLVVPDEPAALLDAAAPVLMGPVVLLLCVFVVAKLMMSGTAPFTRWCAGLAVLGAAAKSAADALANGGLGDRVHWYLALTVAAHALLAAALWVNQVQVAGNPRVLTRRQRPYSLLPYGAIAVTYGLLVFALVRDEATVPIAVGGAAVSTLLVVGRQLAAFRENARLLGELNDRVRELHDTQDGLRASLAERDTLAAQLRHQAYHDTLTGLPNRALYGERLSEALATGEPAVVMVVDLDDFKRVNDEFGHAAGDVLLRTVAGRIQDCVRDTDTVARLGGDEFAVLLAAGPPDPIDVAARIVAAVEVPVEVEGGFACVGASVGVAHASSPNGDEVLREADRAMYAAKHAGKGAFAVAP